MSKNTEIKYTVVKVADITLALDASGRAEVAGRTMANNEGQVWEQTVVAVMDKLDKAKIVRGTNKESLKANQKVVKDILQGVILSTQVIPEEGKNREGKTFKVCGKDGIPQWSSWDKTRRIWDYAGSIAKVLSFGQEAVLYPEAMKVAGRCDILALCKESEGHMDAIKRQCTGLQHSLDKVGNNAEAHTALSLVEALTVNNLELQTEIEALIAKLAAKLSCATEAEKRLIMPAMVAVADHFNGIA